MWYNTALKLIDKLEKVLPDRDDLFITGIKDSLASLRARIKEEKRNANSALKRK